MDIHIAADPPGLATHAKLAGKTVQFDPSHPGSVSKQRRGLRSLDPNQENRVPLNGELGPTKSWADAGTKPRATPVTSKRSQGSSQPKLSIRSSKKHSGLGGGGGTAVKSTKKASSQGESKTPRSRRALGDVSNRAIEVFERGATTSKTPVAKTPVVSKTPGKSGFRILKTHQTPRLQATAGGSGAVSSAPASQTKPRAPEAHDDVPDIELPAGRVYEDEQAELEAVREERFQAELRELFKPGAAEGDSLGLRVSHGSLDDLDTPDLDGLEFTELAMLDDLEFDRVLEAASEKQAVPGQEEKKRVFNPADWQAEVWEPEEDELLFSDE